MRAALIHQGEAYAYARITERHQPPTRSHYLKATVLAPPKSGQVRIHVEHPDAHVEDWDETVATRLIAGPWDEVPPENSDYGTDYLPDEEQPPPPEGRDRLPYTDQLKMTYARYAATKYADVLAQRHRVDQLKALGITRRHQHYAGLGGTERTYGEGRQGTDVRRFGDDEMDRLLSLAEAGQRAPETVAYLVSDLETREDAAERTVIGSHVSLLDLDHYDVAQRDAAEPDKVTQLMTHGAELRVYRVVRDQ